MGGKLEAAAVRESATMSGEGEGCSRIRSRISYRDKIRSSSSNTSRRSCNTKKSNISRRRKCSNRNCGSTSSRRWVGAAVTAASAAAAAKEANEEDEEEENQDKINSEHLKLLIFYFTKLQNIFFPPSQTPGPM